MTDSQRTIVATIRETLGTQLNIDFNCNFAGDSSQAVLSIEKAIKDNTQSIEALLIIMTCTCHTHLKAIEELSRLNDQMETRLKELKTSGERPTIPIEKRSPNNRNKAG